MNHGPVGARVLVAALSDPRGNPRPNRVLRTLASHAHTTFFGPGGSPVDGVDHIPYRPRARSRWVRGIRTLLGDVERSILAEYEPADLAALSAVRADVVVCEDLRMLPALRRALPSARFVIDLRELYSHQFSDSWRWRLVRGREYRRLIESIEAGDVLWTVSTGLQQRYEEEYGLTSAVVRSLPLAVPDLRPSPVEPGVVRLLYHGAAVPARSLELVIRAAAEVGPPITLDLYLVPTDPTYLHQLERLATGIQNVTIRPPVPYTEIIPTSNRYDVGICFYPPVNPNMEHALPNKFFEFVQARIGVLAGPSPDMKALIEEHGFGVVTPDFSLPRLRDAMAALGEMDLQRLKCAADRAARVLHHGANEPRILADVLGIVC